MAVELNIDPTVSDAGLRERVAAYVALTKPRIIELLLLTTLPVMFLASNGVPPLGLVAATLVGGTLSAGSANALNCVVDADIDARMRRTRRRPLARNEISRPAALAFGLVLGIVSTLVLGLLVNWLSAGLEFDAVIALYHDQATIPVKAFSFGSAVNVTLGLPLIRTSVDHGTAFDIVGKGVADASSMVSAIKLAAELVMRQKER